MKEEYRIDSIFKEYDDIFGNDTTEERKFFIDISTFEFFFIILDDEIENGL